MEARKLIELICYYFKAEPEYVMEPYPQGRCREIKKLIVYFGRIRYRLPYDEFLKGTANKSHHSVMQNTGYISDKLRRGDDRQLLIDVREITQILDLYEHEIKYNPYSYKQGVLKKEY